MKWVIQDKYGLFYTARNGGMWTTAIDGADRYTTIKDLPKKLFYDTGDNGQIIPCLILENPTDSINDVFYASKDKADDVVYATLLEIQ